MTASSLMTAAAQKSSKILVDEFVSWLRSARRAAVKLSLHVLLYAGSKSIGGQSHGMT